MDQPLSMIHMIIFNKLNAWIKTQSSKYQHFFSWLNGILVEVAEQQKLVNGQFTDNIDTKVAELNHNRHFKSCPNCGYKDVPK